MRSNRSYLGRVVARAAMPAIAPVPMLFRTEAPPPSFASLSPATPTERLPAPPPQRATTQPLAVTHGPGTPLPNPRETTAPPSSAVALSALPAGSQPQRARSTSAGPLSAGITELSGSSNAPPAIAEPARHAAEPGKPIDAIPAVRGADQPDRRATTESGRTTAVRQDQFAAMIQDRSTQELSRPPVQVRPVASSTASTEADIASTQTSRAASQPMRFRRIPVAPTTAELGVAAPARTDVPSLASIDATPSAIAPAVAHKTDASQGPPTQPRMLAAQLGPSPRPTLPPAVAAIEPMTGRRPLRLDPTASGAPSAGVTIGRLDVRITPPTPALPPVRRAAPPAASGRLARGFPTFGFAQS